MTDMSDLLLKMDDDDLTEAYCLAMESIIQKRGGDRSIVYKSLMENAPVMGMPVIQERGVYNDKPGMLMWTYGVWNEIDFLYDEGDEENYDCLYVAKNEHDAEAAFESFRAEICKQ